MAGYRSTDPCQGTLLQGASAAVTGVAITGTAGQFSCTASTLVVGMQLKISGTYGGTGSITGYVDPTTYVISVTNGSTTFTLTAIGGAALVTTAGTPTGLTYTIAPLQSAAGVIGYTAGTAYDTLLYGIYIQQSAGPPTLTIAGIKDSLGVAQNLVITGSTTVDVSWTPDAPILNAFAPFVFTPSLPGKIWVFTRSYVGPERPGVRVTT